MNKFAGFCFCMLLTGCQSVERKIADLPSIGFDPVITNKSESYTDGKVTFLVESSGTDTWFIAKNGTKDFIELSNMNLAGSRCTYSARGKQLLPPGTVSSYRVPTIGLLGLCYSNEDQLTFINHSFKQISPKSLSSNTLPLLFSVKYEFPGVSDSKETTDSQSLFLNFTGMEQS
ncbi:hypothetical protein FIP36_17065 [Salmonella enterica]|nr:hypothetical protein [Salmonella enterica]EEX1006935.1 hypothetical protein [Escherichia coli]